MRFFKEYWGIIWEFDSVKDFAHFQIGRLLGTLIGYIIVGAVICWFLFDVLGLKI